MGNQQLSALNDKITLVSLGCPDPLVKHSQRCMYRVGKNSLWREYNKACGDIGASNYLALKSKDKDVMFDFLGIGERGQDYNLRYFTGTAFYVLNIV